MKRSCLIRFYPQITPNGQLVHFKDRKEILSVLGFCAPEILPADVDSEEKADRSSRLEPVFADPARKIVSYDHRTLTIKKEVRLKGRSPKVRIPS